MSYCHQVCQDLTVSKSVSSLARKKRHIPSASAIPVTRPENKLTIASPVKPPVGKPSKPIWRKTVLTPSPNELLSTPEPDTPWVQSQVGSTPLTAGTNQLQKEKAIAVPVTKAARKPARDLRGARGRPKIGTRAGSGGVLEPHRRPKVEAAVSAQESLLGEKVQMR